MLNKIIKKLASLKRIKPAHDYAALSRSLILNPTEAKADEFAIAKLAALKSIVPNANWALNAKLSILESPRKQKITLAAIIKSISASRLAYRAAVYAMGVGLTAVIVFVVMNAADYLGSPLPIISNAENNKLISEAGRVANDIDIHLQEINYYALTARKASVALNKAAGISSGAKSLPTDNPTYYMEPPPNLPGKNSDIDALLNKAL